MKPEQVDVRRLRILAAVSLGVACASVGFMGGWFASRLVPAETQSAAVTERKLPAPAADLSGPSKAQSNRHEVATASPNSTGNAGATSFTVARDQDQPAAQQGKDEKNQPDTAAAAKPKIEEAYGGATIINAGSAEKKTATQDASPPSQPVARPAHSEPDAEPASDQPNRETAPERTADEGLLARCARRYASFRASDGTYQPYDGGPRKLCSLLR